jgi:thiamine biosynthesis lipoprotein ApbE
MPSVGTISVTVIADNATLADGLSTALFVMQPNDAINMLKKYPGVDAIIYYQSEDGIVSLKSEGMKKYLIKEKSINEN